jgi:hypothetical protein
MRVCIEWLVTCPPNPPKAGKAGLYRMAFGQHQANTRPTPGQHLGNAGNDTDPHCPPNPHCPPLAGSAGNAGSAGKARQVRFAKPTEPSNRYALHPEGYARQASLVTCPPKRALRTRLARLRRVRRAFNAGLYRMAGYLPAEPALPAFGGFGGQCGFVGQGKASNHAGK